MARLIKNALIRARVNPGRVASSKSPQAIIIYQTVPPRPPLVYPKIRGVELITGRAYYHIYIYTKKYIYTYIYTKSCAYTHIHSFGQQHIPKPITTPYYQQGNEKIKRMKLDSEAAQTDSDGPIKNTLRAAHLETSYMALFVCVSCVCVCVSKRICVFVVVFD